MTWLMRVLTLTSTAADTLYIMSGLGLVDRVDEDRYNANAITRHMVDMPSAQHGALHLLVFRFRPCVEPQLTRVTVRPRG